MGSRPGISLLLIAGSIVLLISIVVGNSMGNHVLMQVAKRAPEEVPTPVISASVDPGDGASGMLAQRRSVLSVATDPAFPDPRVTPEPPPPATPRPTPKPTPRPTPAPSDAGMPGATNAPYTSPPLPLPLVSHEPGETSDEDGNPVPSPSPAESPGTRATPP